MGGKGSGRKRMGRPPRLTQELGGKIAGYIEAGNFLESASHLCGVSPRICREWIAKGLKTKRQPYYDFAQAIKKAESKAEASAIIRIRNHGTKTWQAEAWYLERRFPDKWGRKLAQAVHVETSKVEPSDKERTKILRSWLGMDDKEE